MRSSRKEKRKVMSYLQPMWYEADILRLDFVESPIYYLKALNSAKTRLFTTYFQMITGIPSERPLYNYNDFIFYYISRIQQAHLHSYIRNPKSSKKNYRELFSQYKIEYLDHKYSPIQASILAYQRLQQTISNENKVDDKLGCQHFIDASRDLFKKISDRINKTTLKAICAWDESTPRLCVELINDIENFLTLFIEEGDSLCIQELKEQYNEYMMDNIRRSKSIV